MKKRNKKNHILNKVQGRENHANPKTRENQPKGCQEKNKRVQRRTYNMYIYIYTEFKRHETPQNKKNGLKKRTRSQKQQINILKKQSKGKKTCLDKRNNI